VPQLSNLLGGLQLDFSIVVVSVVVLALDALLPSVQWLKGLRVLRALKPLRSQPFTNSACCTQLRKGLCVPAVPSYLGFFNKSWCTWAASLASPTAIALIMCLHIRMIQ